MHNLQGVHPADACHLLFLLSLMPVLCPVDCGVLLYVHCIF